ncbi:YdcF family protein [Dyadobacter sandarakinus]|uniref:YdcF family protein n=1 Tax=Dyadobacter sandarakinus TaxID=2747268 RepID=A0ABX7I7J7_9BACT|nr:YdcF family protein [Dyadobacter sandarakinus]QRR02071.1 YdcF family protein [Dyadobacter sandarakinus]
MFFFLSKAIDFLAMPLSIILCVLLFGIFTNNKKRKQVSLLIVFVLLFVISNGFLVNKAFNLWEPDPVNLSTIRNAYDVGILLSGGLVDARDPNADQVYFGRHGDRLLQTFLLYKAGKIRKVLITGTSADSMIIAGKGETRQAAQLLVQWGVPAGDILFEEKARNTRENAMFSSTILKSRFPGGKFLLITSAFHMRRSVGCFRKFGIETDSYPADFYGGYYPFNLKSVLIPNAEAVAGSGLLWHEWIGYTVYKAVGYSK